MEFDANNFCGRFFGSGHVRNSIANQVYMVKI